MCLLISGDGQQILYVFYAKAKVKVITSLINKTQQGQGALAVFRWQEVHVETVRHGYHGYKNLSIGLKPNLAF